MGFSPVAAKVALDPRAATTKFRSHRESSRALSGNIGEGSALLGIANLLIWRVPGVVGLRPKAAQTKVCAAEGSTLRDLAPYEADQAVHLEANRRDETHKINGPFAFQVRQASCFEGIAHSWCTLVMRVRSEPIPGARITGEKPGRGRASSGVQRDTPIGPVRCASHGSFPGRDGQTRNDRESC